MHVPRKILLTVSALLAPAGLLAALTVPAQAANVVPSAYGTAGNDTFTLHVTNAKGWEVRASALCEYGVNGTLRGTWTHGPWINRPGTSEVVCAHGIFNQGIRAWGFNWGSPSSWEYHQLGSR